MLFFLLNLFFTWWMWKLAQDHFEQGNTTAGWIGIALSAANFANALSLVL